MKNKIKKHNEKIFLVILLMGLFFVISAKSAKAANDCACAERVALTLYDIKSIFSAGSNGACMDKCRNNDNEFYTFPDVSSLTVGSYRLMYVDGFRYASNCACLKGSVIPTYYPVGSLNQVSGSSTECNNICYTKSADYYAYENSGALSGWKTKVMAPAITAPSTPASKKFEYTLLESFPGFFTGGTTMTDLPTMILAIYKFGIWTVGIAGLFMLVVGGFMYMASAGNTSTASSARGIIADSLLGIVAALGAYLILYVINPDLTKITIGSSFVAVKVGETTGSGGSTPGSLTGACVGAICATCKPGTICAECKGCANFSNGYGSLCYNNGSVGSSGCKLNNVLSSKLNNANLGSVGAQISEAWPPTVFHTAKCHQDGTCADVRCVNGCANVSIANIKKIYDTIKAAGLNPVFENTAANCPQYKAADINCISPDTMTSPSFHVNM